LTVRGSTAAGPMLWLFDFDNTLAALEPEVDWAASRCELEAFLRSEGIGGAIFEEFPKGNLLLYDALRSRLRNGLQRPVSSASSDLLLRRASDIIETHELRGVDRAVPLPGAEELLRSLSAIATSVVVVTSNSSRTVGRWLELHHLTGVVRAIVGRDSMLALKPSPDSVNRALALCSASPGDAIFVGDSEADLRAACAAQVDFYGLATRPVARARLVAAGADRVFVSPAALAASLGMSGASEDV
jgi:phosphoglycolate phosphatase-like HAD superfamily hydrolase